MTKLSIVVTAIFLVALIVQLVSFVRSISYILRLQKKRIEIRRWSRWAAVKDLKVLLRSNTAGGEVKEIARALIRLTRIGIYTFWGSVVLIILSFIINGFLNKV